MKRIRDQVRRAGHAFLDAAELPYDIDKPSRDTGDGSVLVNDDGSRSEWRIS